MTRPELLAPAGDMDKLRTCLLYGADAVYLGGKSGNLRAACEGFGPAELAEAARLAEEKGARIYYCLNSFALEKHLPGLPEQIESAAAAGVHGLIVADPGVIRLARRHAPRLPVHLSTQANTSNSESVLFWQDMGVSRVNLARELSCRDIHALRRRCPGMELEVFVHGAMCLALSGQCLLSAWLNGRSGNQGRCTQPCRFEYRALGLDGGRASGRRAASSLPEGSELLVEEYTRPGEHVWSARRAEGDEPFSSFWAPEDLCLYPWLPWFLHNRVTALKIEGRMKSAGWAAHAVDVYRTALDALSAPDGPGKAPFRPEAGMRELLYAATRPLGSGFFLPERRHLTREFLERGEVAARPNRSGEGAIPLLGREVLARVLEEKSRGVWLVEAHGNWRREQDVEIMLPGMRRPLLIGGSYGLENQRGELIGRLGNGNRGLLYADQDDLAAGLFIRASACR